MHRILPSEVQVKATIVGIHSIEVSGSNAQCGPCHRVPKNDITFLTIAKLIRKEVQSGI